ncbi:hypothetical protein D9601_15005 [Sphingomonas sp. MA1305]|nr:hypothetical protein [Sphingomonas sp. MA1305]
MWRWQGGDMTPSPPPFERLIREAEAARDQAGSEPLARAFAQLAAAYALAAGEGTRPSRSPTRP